MRIVTVYMASEQKNTFLIIRKEIIYNALYICDESQSATVDIIKTDKN